MPMTNKECGEKFYKIKDAAGASQRYHQIMEWRYGFADKCLRLAVGILAMVGLLTSTVESWAHFSLPVAVAALVVAVGLNVFLFGDREKKYGEWFRRWTDLRKDVDIQLSKVDAADDGKSVGGHVSERYRELLAKSYELDALEPAPYRGLQKRCEGDEIESEWGEGIRTLEQAQQEHEERFRAPVSEE